MEYGSDADFILLPALVGRTLSVNIYGINVGGNEFTDGLSANVYWRYAGGAWNSAAMVWSGYGNPRNYTYTFPSAGSIEYYVEGIRSGVAVRAFRPVYYQGTDPNSPPPEYFSAYLN